MKSSYLDCVSCARSQKPQRMSLSMLSLKCEPSLSIYQILTDETDKVPNMCSTNMPQIMPQICPEHGPNMPTTCPNVPTTCPNMAPTFSQYAPYMT